MKVDASETIVNKENLNIRDGGAHSVEDSTISHMECLEDETPQFDKNFIKDDASETIVNKESLNLGDGGAQGVEDEIQRFDKKIVRVD